MHPCPFLSKFSKSFLWKNGQMLMKDYQKFCPVMQRMASSTTGTTTTGNQSEVKDLSNGKCPFLATAANQGVIKEASSEICNDVIHQTMDHLNLGQSPQSQNDKYHHFEEMQQKQHQENTFPYEKFYHARIMSKVKDHSYRIFKKVTRLAENFPKAKEYTEGEKGITVWCANDYLGMSCHPKVKEAVRYALDLYGAGAGGTRNISGNSILHEALEAELASLHNKPAALLFTSCYVANHSTLYTLAKLLPNCIVFSDEGNHASMIQGIINSGVQKKIFRKYDPAHLEELMSSVPYETPKIVAYETVHSMDGSIAPVKEMNRVIHKYGGIGFVDEVHAVGLYGDQGAGIGERDGELDEMDIISGTLGKAFGNIGGYIAGSSLLIDMIRSYASGFIFTTSLPPTVLAGSIASIKILRSEEGQELRYQQQWNVRYLKQLLNSSGFPLEPSPSHIIPIKIGDPLLTKRLSDQLLKTKGHYVQPINYPTVNRGQEKIRIAPTPYHTQEMMDMFAKNLLEVWLDIGIPLRECSYCKDKISFNQENVHQIQPQICRTPNCPQIPITA